MRYLIIFLLAFSHLSYAQTDTISVVAYNVLNFPDGRDDCGSNVVVPNRSDTLRKVLSYLKPDIFVACEIQTKAGADSILTRSLNVHGSSNYAAANYVNSSNLNNNLYYNTDKLTLQSQSQIPSSPRNIDHYVLYCNDPNLGVYFDTTFIEVYMCHLKAGSSSTNQSIRAVQTQELMDYISLRPTDRNHFVCGDFNVYSSNEPAYQNFFNGPAALIDPINSPGNWNNNGTYAEIHTQSTRSNLNFDCGAKGGSDDRFDQILVSSNVMDGSDSLKYLVGSYDAVGNDGSYYNSNLLTSLSGTGMYPDSVISALYYMSDHLPVVLKSVVTYPTSNGLALYPVINSVTCPEGSDGSAEIVANDGQPPYTYQWDANAGNQSTATAENLTSGSYCVDVTDALGEIDSYCVSVPQPDVFSSNVFKQPDLGNCDGEAYLFVEGGTEPYSYQWNDPASQTGSAGFDLCFGEYEVTVTDANGCEFIVDISIDGTGDLSTQSLDLVKVYPNPTNGELVIRAKQTIKSTDIKLVNAIGSSIPVVFHSIDNNLIQTDLNTLPKGYYFIQVKLQNRTLTQKVVKI